VAREKDPQEDEGEAPEGEAPEADAREGEVPEGEAPEGEAPEGEAPEASEGESAGDGGPDEPPEGLVSPLVACALAALGGALFFLGMPGMDLWPVAFVAQAPFYLALLHQPPRRAAALGLLHGFTFSVGTFHWLHGTLKVFGGFPSVVCFIVTMLFCVYQGGRAALTGWLTARAEQRGWPPAVAFVLALTTGELLYPLLFPWYFAVIGLGAPWFVQAGDLGGPLLVTALLTGSSLAIAELVRARIERDRPSRALIGAGLAATLLSGVYGAARMRQIDGWAAEAPKLDVGVAQGNLPLMVKKAGSRVHRRLTRDLVDQGVGLVVWSEGSVSQVFDEATYREDTYQQISRGIGVPTLIGGGVKRGEGAERTEFNTALLTDRDGQVIGRYDKQYLLPFGEYMPLGKRFPWLHEYSPRSGHLSPGESVAPVIMDGHPLTIIICYEDLLPSFVNGAVQRGKTELLVNMTIDTWFGDSIAPWEHLGLAQLRAVEHRRYLVRATNSGVSAVVDAAGRVTKHGKMFTRETFVAPVRLMASTTLYEIVGDAPFWLGAAAVGGMALLRRPRRKRVTSR
jgi:apolipoprotein N-acyltransferase